jgi:hypothetical protein
VTCCFGDLPLWWLAIPPNLYRIILKSNLEIIWLMSVFYIFYNCNLFLGKIS